MHCCSKFLSEMCKAILTISEQWISDFREFGNTVFKNLVQTKKPRKEKASEINKRIKEYKEKEIAKIKGVAKSQNWKNDILLNEILVATYASYIVMLEYRNKVWEYEYMAFARRIG